MTAGHCRLRSAACDSGVPTAGSGSQHVAGEKLGRLVYGMEREPAYVAGILERLSKMGLSPVLETIDQPTIS